MAGKWTDRGPYLILETYFRGATAPTVLYLALCTSAITPDRTTNTLSQLTEIAAGNGYTTGGYSLSRNSTDFDTLTENDVSFYAQVQIKDVVWTASGALPASGNGARWAVLLTDEATVGNRQVLAYFDLGSDQSLTSGQTLTLQDATLRLSPS